MLPKSQLLIASFGPLRAPMLLKRRPKGAHHEHHSAPHGPMLPKSRLKASIMSICGLFQGTAPCCSREDRRVRIMSIIHSAPHGPMLPKSRVKASIMSICGLFHGTYVAQELASQSIIWSCQGPMLLKRRPKGAHHEHHSAPHGPMLPNSRLKASIMSVGSWDPCCPRASFSEHHLVLSGPHVAQEKTEGCAS